MPRGKKYCTFCSSGSSFFTCTNAEMVDNPLLNVVLLESHHCRNSKALLVNGAVKKKQRERKQIAAPTFEQFMSNLYFSKNRVVFFMRLMGSNCSKFLRRNLKEKLFLLISFSSFYSLLFPLHLPWFSIPFEILVVPCHQHLLIVPFGNHRFARLALRFASLTLKSRYLLT
jgi:hypothetical protein